MIQSSKYDLANKERLGIIAFPLAKKTPQLQAADLLAYLTRENIEEGGFGLHSPPRSWLAACLANTRMLSDYVHLDKDEMRKRFRNSGR